MKNNSYINRIVDELLHNNELAARAELSRAQLVLEEISDLPSPLKEEVFVRMVLEHSSGDISADSVQRRQAA